MYLRFKTSFSDDRENRYGVFQAAHFLLHNDTLYEYDKEQLEETWGWFRHNLLMPRVYRSRKSTSHIVCWFKPTAIEHLRKMHEMNVILESYGLCVSRIKSRKPGYIVYEDEDQVAAIPFTKLVKQIR